MHIQPTHPSFNPPTLESVLSIISSSTTPWTHSDIISLHSGKPAPEDLIEQNTSLANLVRERSITHGYFAAWKLLADLISPVSESASVLPSELVADVLKCIAVYSRMRQTDEDSQRRPTDLSMAVTRELTRDSIYCVGAKSLGGKEWVGSEEYTPEAQRKWSDTKFATMSPCSSFAWLGPQHKTIARDDLNAADALALLGTVDYDYDRDEAYSPGFAHAMKIGRSYIADGPRRMQAFTLAAFLNLDVQTYVRQMHENWVAEEKSRVNDSPRCEISPADWFVTVVADSGSLGPFGYETSAVYKDSKGAMFGALFMGHCFDLLFDRISSNAMSSVKYLSATGVTEHDVHTAFATTVADRTARRALGVRDLALFGENSVFSMGVWSSFNGRYRTWERFVKYMRQLARSTDPKGERVLEMASELRMLPDGDTADVEELWHRATTPGVEKTLIRRVAVVQNPSPAPELMHLPQPTLCAACELGFRTALEASETDQVHVAAELPAASISSPAVARAAAIRRAAIFATEPTCCDPCASRIGCWADSSAHTVLTALMKSDQNTSASEWMLQCHGAWAVTTWPVSVATVLSGFDLICLATQENGAMGQRDFVDC
ncbi:hypothetical protein FB45DRAFT_898563 [Roridomyces roridus]|uniref:Uncharacterized protein n=1 Tax=Roridomyces roridus TaxID=1738132 RepID=A0AAD7CCP4_9AGAR|nr:hypothetical protein FB45DRAFT_898563 [Roridomyces roridus]